MRIKVFLPTGSGLVDGALRGRDREEEWPWLSSGDIIHVGVPDEDRPDGIASVRSSGTHIPGGEEQRPRRLDELSMPQIRRTSTIQRVALPSTLGVQQRLQLPYRDCAQGPS